MRNGGDWTEARFRSFIISALRAASRRWPVKWKVMKGALAGTMVNPQTGKKVQQYRCAMCRNLFPAGNMVVDHIEPVVDTMQGFVDWNTYIERMFCEADGLQPLCKGCHDVKTKREKQERKDAAKRKR